MGENNRTILFLASLLLLAIAHRYDTNYGEGMIIGVVDTGIIPTHPSFNDDGMPPPPSKWRGRCDFDTKSLCNKKLIGARAFTGGHNPSPLDLDGHGTHCAGVAAGNYVYGAHVLGIAPKAHVAMYKACCLPDQDVSWDLLDAIEQAISDGVDVLSISLGGIPGSFDIDPLAVGAFAAMVKGILTVTPAGNSGPLPSTIKNDAPWILTVGASSMDRRITAKVRLGNGVEFDGVSGYQPAGYFSSPMQPMVNPADLRIAEDFSCQKGSLDSLDVGGKIVLCGSSTGFIDSKEMAEVVKAAGGSAMIVTNQQPHEELTLKAMPMAMHPSTNIPVAHISFDDARKIQQYYLSTTDHPTATILFKRPLSPEVASFSSRGPSLMNGGVLKPDVIGPGVYVLGPGKTELCPHAITNSGIFCFKSGTSMATPHLAGVAALLKKSHPQWSPAAIKSAIMTTAHTLDFQEGKPISDKASGEPANIFAMGAGQVNPNKADDPGLVYDIQPDDYIPYLCGGGLGYTDQQASTVVGKEIFCSRYQKMAGTEELNYPSILVSMGWASNKTVRRTVTNVGEAHSVYSVKVDEPKGVTVVVSPRKLQFSALGEQKTFSVTFSTAEAPPIWPIEVLEGQLVWVSNKHAVRSPIGVSPES